MAKSKLEKALSMSALAQGYKRNSNEFKRYVQGTLDKLKEGKKKDGRV